MVLIFYLCLEAPLGLVLNYYQDILEALHPTEVADKMLRKGLLNASTFKMISNAPCDYIGNKIIMEKLRQKDTSGLFMFLDILQEIGNYGIIHSALMSGKSEMHNVSQYFNCYAYGKICFAWLPHIKSS